MMELLWEDAIVQLLPQRAVWWPRERTLFVADLHLGKGQTFRTGGIPIPAGTTRDDLDRLRATAEGTGAQRIVILGDFLHARSARAAGVLASLERWRSALGPRELLLVRGNHDRSAGDPPSELAMRAVDAPYGLGPFVLRHEPSTTSPETMEMAGHLHPSVVLEGPARGRMRAPCFWLSERRLVLPAFGGFTGTSRVRPRPGDRVFVVGDGDVVEVPGVVGRGPG